MDQKKIGSFLRGLRLCRDLTQEALAEELGVTNRSISRWETGATMPDLILLIELAKFYGVGVDEILDAKSKGAQVNEETERLLKQVAEYENSGLATYSKRVRWMFVAAVACMVVYAAIDIAGLWNTQPYEAIGNVMLGFVLGTLLTGIIYTSGKLSEVKASLARRDA